MRRVFVLGAVLLLAAGAYGVIAAVSRCGHSEKSAPGEASRGAIAGKFDPAMSGVCRFACATRVKYDSQDVLAQPGAQTGKLTQCPVSGVVFAVDSSRPHVSIQGHDYVACCGNCAEKLQHDPQHYLKV